MVRFYLSLFFLLGCLVGFAQQIEPQLGPAPLLPLHLQRSEQSPTHTLKTIPNARLAATCDRTTIINDYNTNFLGSAVSNTDLAWTGTVAGCVAGSISSTAQNRVIQRINYYRKLVGLPSNMTFDPSRNANNQAASLMMKAQNALSHCTMSDPCTSFACYSTSGATGAQYSNIALGSHSSNAVKLYIDDPGAGNIAAGHRRWILYSRSASFGQGSTDNSDALWVFNTFVTPSSLPTFIAWPAAGYVPRGLISYRWSFGIPNADFSSCTVTVQDDNNNNLSITKHAVSTGYGDNTVVWDLNNAADYTFSGTLDRLYKVTISGVKIGGVTQPNYQYNVVAIEPSTPNLTISAIHPTCGTSLNNGSATANFDRGAKSFLWNTGATTQTISNLAPGTYTVTVTDKNDCTYVQSVVLNNTTVSTPTIANTACNNGNITLTAGNCNGTYQWSHGLGTGSVKTVSPQVTTSYQVTCSEGTCVSTPTSSSISPIPQNAACIPTTSNGTSVYYGITNFTFNTINKSSGTSQADGANYIDRTCTDKTTVIAGNSYTMSVRGAFTNGHTIKVYIDYNGNGSFTDTDEQVMSGNSFGLMNNILSSNITIPLTAKLDSALRVRVVADPQSSSNSCNIVGSSSFGAGQAEDYTVMINQPCLQNITLQSPIHDFSTGDRVRKASSGNGLITATNKITNNGVVSYESKAILLNPGFLANNGTIFVAKTGGCP